MVSWYALDYVSHARAQELVRAAERQRLIQAAQTRRQQPQWLGQGLIWLGRRLITWGGQLQGQSRGDVPRTSASQSNN
jgi:hypothetical protein